MVAPTSAQGASWRRSGTVDDRPARAMGDATEADIQASVQSLPAPIFEKTAAAPAPAESQPILVRPSWTEPAAPPASAPTLAIEPVFVAPVVPAKTPIPASPAPTLAAVAAAPAVVLKSEPATSVQATPGVANPIIPLSDFEDVYRKAGIKSPVHGYGVERVYRLLTSRRLVGLDRSVRRSALLTALDAAGVPPSDVSQDAVLRRKALTAYEAEKALELQSLRSRNESRAEALQDTVETFTRQKQSQIERLAQGSTSAVRAQSDLEIRKRMEQDRLYRSLAYFVEPLPTPQAPREARAIEIRPALFESAARFEETVSNAPVDAPDASPGYAETVQTADLEGPLPGIAEISVVPDAVVITPDDVRSSDNSADTRPMSQLGLEMALRAAAQEAKSAGWGQAAIIEDGAADTVDALRKLREGQKTDSES